MDEGLTIMKDEGYDLLIKRMGEVFNIKGELNY
jgi:hypothetical protein